MTNDSTKIDIETALREIVTRMGAVAHDPTARGDVRTLAAAVALLASIIGQLEQGRS